ncbi:hypothetical protein RUND412_007616 [Rhizina undulata]
MDSHSYPSQHISHSNPLLEPAVPPVLESTAYSQDHPHLEDEKNSIPLPSYQLSHSTLPPIAPAKALGPSSNPFKRPYQPDQTPVSSPGHSTNTLPPTTKRRKSTSKEAWTMSEDDNLLLQLKDEEGIPWKAIAQKFRDLNRGEFRVPTLQMRYKRLKEKMRVWDADDVQYLKEAKEYLEKQKWEIISQKMVELGCKKKIPASTCEKKWKEIDPQQPPLPQTPSMQSHEMTRESSQVSDEG